MVDSLLWLIHGRYSKETSNIICHEMCHHEIFPVAAWFCKWVSTCIVHFAWPTSDNTWNFLLAAELQLHRGCRNASSLISHSLKTDLDPASAPQSTYVIPSVFLKITSTDNLHLKNSVEWGVKGQISGSCPRITESTALGKRPKNPPFYQGAQGDSVKFENSWYRTTWF